jgi:hypothetical protein
MVNDETVSSTTDLRAIPRASQIATTHTLSSLHPIVTPYKSEVWSVRGQEREGH